MTDPVTTVAFRAVAGVAFAIALALSVAPGSAAPAHEQAHDQAHEQAPDRITGVSVTLAPGPAGDMPADFAALVSPWEEATGNRAILLPLPASTSDRFGQYRLWLMAQNPDIDLYQTAATWAPQLAAHFTDLLPAARDAGLIADIFPALIDSQTVSGRLVALPVIADAAALYYRSDLLDRYDAAIPATWADLTTTAARITAGEREGGNAAMWGLVFQGAADEGLTGNALEWMGGWATASTDDAAAALDMAAGWIGTISPPDVLTLTEQDPPDIWQEGNAVFMRGLSAADLRGNAEGSAIRDRFDIAPLPAGANGAATATLGGSHIAVSRYSPRQEAAISLALYLGSPEAQKQRALASGALPVSPSLYADPDILGANPHMPRWHDVLLAAMPRPAATLGADYSAASTLFFTAVHNVIAGTSDAHSALTDLQTDLEYLFGD